LHEGRFDIPFGFDEMLLAALALGATGAVGSSFNFAAPVYLRVIGAFQRGDFTAAREEQMKSVRLIQALASRGYMGAAKAVMAMLGVEVGPPRLPCAPLDADQTKALRSELEQMGFFEWVKS
jgi:N-acetylneuraminate lyase